MKLEIADLLLYGEWDESTCDYPGDTVWLEKSSEQFFLTDDLTHFGYDNYEDIEDSGYFVPLFRTSITELMRKYILLCNDREAEEEINRIVREEDEEYPVAFRIYSEVHPDFESSWIEFESSKLEKDAREWAKKQGIEFYGDYDSERKLNLSENKQYFYNLDEDGSCSGFWLSKKDYSIIDMSDRKEIIDLEKLTQEEFDKEYIPIPCVSEDEAKSVGMKWEEMIIKTAKKWCNENSILWFIPSGKPDHIK